MKKTLFASILFLSLLKATDPDYTIAFITDPQFLHNSCPAAGINMANWIVSNKVTWNIQVVLTAGDNVDVNADNTGTMANAVATFTVFDTAGIPYLETVGNHDHNPAIYDSTITRTSVGTFFGSGGYFGPTSRAAKAYWGGSYDTTGTNTYIKLTVGGRKLLLISVDFNPTSASLDWAKTIHDANPTYETLFVSHAPVYPDGTFGADSDTPPDSNNGVHTWANWLSTWPQLTFIMGGHYTTTPPYWSLNTVTSSSARGQGVLKLFANWQNLDAIGLETWCPSNIPDLTSDRAHVVLLKFRPSLGTVELYAISTNSGLWMTDTTDTVTSADSTLLSSKTYASLPIQVNSRRRIIQ